MPARPIVGQDPWGTAYVAYDDVARDSATGRVKSTVPVFNVKDAAFGAAVDLVTDDRAAWQAAINAAVVSGGTVFVPRPGILIASDGGHPAACSWVNGDNVAIATEPGALIKCTVSNKALMYVNGAGKGAATYTSADWYQWSNVHGVSGAPVRGDRYVTLAVAADANTTNFPVGSVVYVRTGAINVNQNSEPIAELNFVVSTDAATGRVNLRFPLTHDYRQEYFAAGGTQTTTTQALGPNQTIISVTSAVAAGLAAGNYVTIIDSNGNALAATLTAVSGNTLTIYRSASGFAGPTIASGAAVHKIANGETSTSVTANKAAFGVVNVTAKTIRNFRMRGVEIDYTGDDTCLALGQVYDIDISDNRAKVMGGNFHTGGNLTLGRFARNSITWRGAGNIGLNGFGTGSSRCHYVDNVHVGEERAAGVVMSEATVDFMLARNQFYSQRAVGAAWRVNDQPIQIQSRSIWASVVDNYAVNGQTMVWMSSNAGAEGFIAGNVASGDWAQTYAVEGLTQNWRFGFNHGKRGDGTVITWPAATADDFSTTATGGTVPKRWRKQSVAMPGTVGGTVALFTATGVSLSLVISITITDSGAGWAQSKQYVVSYAFANDGGTYAAVTPTSDSGASGGNDFDLERTRAGAAVSFRVKRTAGTTGGAVFEASLLNLGGSAATVAIL